MTDSCALRVQNRKRLVLVFPIVWLLEKGMFPRKLLYRAFAAHHPYSHVLFGNRRPDMFQRLRVVA